MGIDISKELIEFARLRLEGLKAELRDQDYFTHHGLYDFVIMRLFWQHLSEDHTRDALEKLEELTRPGSSVLITDAYDEVRQFVPDIPAFRAMINAYTLQQTAVGRNRKIIDVLIDWAKSGDTWQVGEDIRLILPSSMYGYRSLFGRIYELWIELFECLGQLAIDFTEVKGELEKWSRNKASFTQAGLRVIRLDRLK
jgi:SAM-dependent methyltransferase